MANGWAFGKFGGEFGQGTQAYGTFSREDFTFDKDRNVYICPANKILTTYRNASRCLLAFRERQCQPGATPLGRTNPTVR